MKHFLATLLCLSALHADAAEPTMAPPSADTAAAVLKDSPRHGEWVDIALPGSDARIKSWVVYPERQDKAPVVIVIHEIFGLTDWIRSVTDALAANGFIAIAPDLLSGMGPNGGGTEALGEKVREEIRKLSPEEQANRLNAVAAYAATLASANGKYGTVGFCWGGSASFNYSARQKELGAAVVFYGTATGDKELLAQISCPVLGLYGGNDNRVTSTVAATDEAMKALQKSYTVHTYEAAGHGFLRQQSGQNGANEKAARQSWEATIAFLKRHLEK